PQAGAQRVLGPRLPVLLRLRRVRPEADRGEEAEGGRKRACLALALAPTALYTKQPSPSAWHQTPPTSPPLLWSGRLLARRKTARACRSSAPAGSFCGTSLRGMACQEKARM